MKRFVFFLALILAFSLSYAQIPQGISFQGIARDASGDCSANETININIKIIDNIVSGNVVYGEQHTVLTDDQGLFFIEIGKGNNPTTLFTNIDWSSAKWVRTEVNGILIGTISLLSYPYAFYANKSGVADSSIKSSAQFLTINGRDLSLSDANTITLPTIDVGPATGDLSGNYPDPAVIGIRGKPVSTAMPSVGEVLKWTGTEWKPMPDDVATGNGTGVGVNTTARISGDGDSVHLDIARQNASLGQVLKWDSTSWVPALDKVNDDDADPSNELQSLTFNSSSKELMISDGNTVTITGIGLPIGSAGGDLSGSYPNPTVQRIHGRAVDNVPPGVNEILKWDGTSWNPSSDEVNDLDSDPSNELQSLSFNASARDLTISNGNTVNIPDGPPTGVAGGDLFGSYPNPSVQNIQGRAVDNVSPGTNEILKWDGNSWVPAPDNTNDSDSNPTNELQNLSFNSTSRDLTISNGNTVNIPDTGDGPAGGDLSGNYPSPTVQSIQGRAVDNSPPGTNEILKWDGFSWNSSPDNIEDADANPSNELQTLGFNSSSRDLTISNGNTINIPAGLPSGNAGGDLSGNYPNPSVQNIQGRAVDNVNPGTNEILKWDGDSWNPSSDEVNDADADPNNEFQDLSISGSMLSISNGNTVTLPNTGNGGLWTAGTGSKIYYDLDYVGISTTNPTTELEVHGVVRIQSKSALSGNGGILGYNLAGQNTFFLTQGFGGSGYIAARGPNGNDNVVITCLDAANTNKGKIRIEDDNSEEKVELYVNTSNAGEVVLYGGSSGQKIVNITNDVSDIDHGRIEVMDSGGTGKAGFYVNSSSQGVMYADVKNFVMPHPTRPGKRIQYASLEGPEAGAYTRGTAKLVNGEAEIRFSEDFEIVANPNTMTMNLTPLSADSKGLAVVEKTATGFRVKEMWKGKGNYEFDWEVKAVRKGWENYKAIVDEKAYPSPNTTIPDEKEINSSGRRE